MTGHAFAADIIDGHYDQETDEVVLTVSYDGGCEAHQFNLDFDRFCLETYPAQQNAKLIHKDNNDSCKAIIVEEKRIKLGKKAPVCRTAYLTIKGDNGSEVEVLVEELRQ